MRRANKLAAPNAAMTSLFQCGYRWRGIGEPDRRPPDTMSDYTAYHRREVMGYDYEPSGESGQSRSVA